MMCRLTVRGVLVALTLVGCTDPLAGRWQAYSEAPTTGDYELLLESDLTGRIDFSDRRDSATDIRLEVEVFAVLLDRKDGIWSYEIEIDDRPDIDCELDRFTDELECEWEDRKLEFEPLEEDERSCHDMCETGEPLRENCNECAARVCQLDRYCCTKAWDEACERGAFLQCFGSPCGQ